MSSLKFDDIVQYEQKERFGDKYVKIFWSNRPLQMCSNDMTINTKHNYYQALDVRRNVSDFIQKEFMMIKLNPMNLIISGEGPQGGGKTYVLLDLFTNLRDISGLRFDLDLIDFSTTDKIENVEKTMERCIQMTDEQIKTFGEGSQAEEEQLFNIEKIIRQRKQCFGFISPEYIKHHHHYHFLTWEWGSLEPWSFDVPLDEQWIYTKSIIFNRNMYPFGYIITETPSDENLLIAYEKKKSKFLKDFLSGDVRTRSDYVWEKAKDIYMSDDGFMKLFNYSKGKLLKSNLVSRRLGPGHTTKEVKQVVEMLEQKIFDYE